MASKYTRNKVKILDQLTIDSEGKFTGSTDLTVEELETQNEDGNTPLHLIVKKNGRFDLVPKFVTARNVDAVNGYGRTALHDAICSSVSS